MAAKNFLRHLVTSQENHQSWKQIYTRLKMMPTKSFALQANGRILYFIKAHGVFLHLGVLKIELQVNKHHRLNISRKTWSIQHSRQDNIDTSRDSFETYRPSQNDKSTFMIHNHVTIMNHSWWTITRFTAYTYTKTHACAWLFNFPSSTNIST